MTFLGGLNLPVKHIFSILSERLLIRHLDSSFWSHRFFSLSIWAFQCILGQSKTTVFSYCRLYSIFLSKVVTLETSRGSEPQFAPRLGPSRGVNWGSKVGHCLRLRQKCSYGSANIRPAERTVAKFRRTLVAGDEMSTRQEHAVDFFVHADFTRLRLVKSTILLHQHLLLVVYVHSQY